MLFKLKLYAVGFIAVLGLAWAFYVKLKASIRNEIKAKQTEEILDAVKQYKTISDETKTLSDADLDKRNSSWLRK